MARDNMIESDMPDPNILCLDELFDSAAWVMPPTDLSRMARLWLDSDEEEVQEPAAMQTMQAVRDSFSLSHLFPRSVSSDSTEPAGEPLANVAENPVLANKSTDPPAPDPEECSNEPSSFADIYRLSNINRQKNKVWF